MLLTCVTASKKGQYMVGTDIPGAFPHTDMEQDKQILLEGTIAKLIMKLEPRKFVWKNKQCMPMLYIK